MELYNWKEEIKVDELKNVIKILNDGGVVIFPTETVYGIGGNALSCEVIDKIYNIKKRPRDKALNIMLPHINKIDDYAQIESDLERKIIEKFMPGPVTIILKKKEHFGDYFTSNNDTIGIRVPEHKVISEILKGIDFPLIAPSANITGRESGVRISEIIDDFNDKVDVIIDCGDIEKGQASTIVRVVDNEIKILRQGKVTEEEILRQIK